MKNLRELFEAMRQDDPNLPKWDSLPTFGGAEPTGHGGRLVLERNPPNRRNLLTRSQDRGEGKNRNVVILMMHMLEVLVAAFGCWCATILFDDE